ncbi:ABC transporter permease [Streptococcus loxodontisalivarius]|uniref:Iron complex transport system permease protein n=1 Tax=Streptococcus loxodontisalivarius TaxID=1349415 RepID=A0ABS2PR21_9STRE|nr:iron chelate uptake ABC transporter family permease subunit [Streptococcus loxodontisalivarius]MBM7642489.1 iron complex transport system permease protein [Streptococcus loxodontisalivarius]
MKVTYYLYPLFFVLIFLSLSIGASSQFSWSAFLQGEGAVVQVFWESRLPRTLAIVLAAGALSLAGLLMQTITQNPYAAPSTTGTVEAAQLGMLVSLFFFPKASLFQKAIFAFVFANLASLFFIRVVRRLSFSEKWMLALVGLIYGGIIGSLAEVLAYRFNLIQSMTSWTQGSFAMIQNHQYEWLFLNLLTLLGIWYFSESFSLMSLGEDASRSLGLSFEKMESLALFLVSLTTAVTMITVGSLPFLGVIVPNVVRRFSGDHLKKSAGLVFLTGICLVLLCDIFARLIIRPYEVSVSVVLGVIGSALFIFILWWGEKHG